MNRRIAPQAPGPFACRYTHLEIPENPLIEVSPGLNIIVGPNNSGKTRVLKDLLEHARGIDPSDADGMPNPVLVDDYKAQYEFDLGETVAVLTNSAKQISDTNYYDHVKQETIFTTSFQYDHYSINQRTVEDAYNDGKMFKSWESSSVLLDTQARLTLTGFANASESHGEIGLLERFALTSDGISELSRLTESVFGYEIDLWTTGAGYNLVLGKTAVSRDYWSEYQKAAAEQDLVDQQGDGIRSFIGILIALLSERASIILIDEPEAFLHPPQARRLGNIIATFSTDKQIFLATHSAEVVEGALESAGNAFVARITRHENSCRLQPLESTAVLNMAQDPLIRHANLIDGLFSDATVICESDRDAAFYESVWTSRPRVIDVHFTHALGGKSRISNAVDVLMGSGLPVVSITDIDVLDSKRNLQKLRNAHQGIMDDDGEQTLQAIHDELNALDVDVPKRRDVEELLENVMEMEEEYLTVGEVQHLRSIIKTSSGWKKLQKQGLMVLSETTRQRATELLDALKREGVFVVPSGEMESFVPSVEGLDKRSWIIKVLEDRLAEQSQTAQLFVSEVERFLLKKLRRDSAHFTS